MDEASHIGTVGIRISELCCSNNLTEKQTPVPLSLSLCMHVVPIQTGVNPHFIGMSLHDASKLCGVPIDWMRSYDSRPNPNLPSAKEVLGDEMEDDEDDIELPVNYDVREAWGETCPIVLDIPDQGQMKQ